MADQLQQAGLVSRGFMSFTVANGDVLHLGGASQTAPTSHLSGGVSGAGGFLATGIPQKLNKSSFADIVAGDTNGHAIKHAIVTFVSDGGTSPAGRYMTDGSTPTTSLGPQTLTGDGRTYLNSRTQIFNFKWFNRSGGNAVVEVEVFE